MKEEIKKFKHKIDLNNLVGEMKTTLKASPTEKSDWGQNQWVGRLYT